MSDARASNARSMRVDSGAAVIDSFPCLGSRAEKSTREHPRRNPTCRTMRRTHHGSPQPCSPAPGP